MFVQNPVRTLCTRRHVAKTRIQEKTLSATTKKKDEIVQESSTTVRRSKSGFSPLALPMGENPHHFAPWSASFRLRFAYLRRVIIDRILAHFCWILVGRPPLLKPWPTTRYHPRQVRHARLSHGTPEASFPWISRSIFVFGEWSVQRPIAQTRTSWPLCGFCSGVLI